MSESVLENVVPESQVTQLLVALKRLIAHTPLGDSDPERTAARQQAEAAYSEFVCRTRLKPWVITYSHRHGTDVAVVLAKDAPDGEAYYADDFEPEREDEYIDVERLDAVSVMYPKGEDPQKSRPGMGDLDLSPEAGGRER